MIKNGTNEVYCISLRESSIQHDKNWSVLKKKHYKKKPRNMTSLKDNPLTMHYG